MQPERVASILQWIGRVLLVLLCLGFGLLWGRMDRQVAQNKAEIEALKAYADAAAQRVHQENSEDQARLRDRWGNYLMPLLRQHHRTLQALPHPEPVPDLPEWLQEPTP